MPLCYGGGVTTVDQAIKLVDMGVEKVAVSSAAIKRPSFVKELVAAVGSQSVVVILDILLEKNFFKVSFGVARREWDVVCYYTFTWIKRNGL